MNRQLPTTYSGMVVAIDEVLHIAANTRSASHGETAAPLCAVAEQSVASFTSQAQQHYICPRCWQRWRRDLGEDVRAAWSEEP